MLTQINITEYTARDLSKLLRMLYKSPKNGSSRKAYINKADRIVYKLPITSASNKQNEQEYANYIAYLNGESDVKIADCELYYTSDHVPVIVMLYVDVIKRINTYDLPEWARNGNIDTYQVGYDESGNIVSFDHTAPC